MSAQERATDETHVVEHNEESGSTMHMFVRNGSVTLSEENTSDEGRNREDAVITCDESLLTEVRA